MFLVTPIYRTLQNLVVFSWDFILATLNLLTPKRKIGHVIPEGHPGAGGKWPEYVAPREGDSRCSCPALNAMANHGILPHDGKNIKFNELGPKIRTTYNFASTFCFFVPNFAANMLNRSYSKDTFDLADLDLHNGIEHDASLTREDSALVSDQSKPHIPYVKELLASASGKDKDGNPLLTPKDLSDYSAKRRVDARATNPHFTLDFFHKVFGSSNSSTMLTIFGGRISDLESILVEERIPEGWESRVRKRMGLTFAAFNSTVLKVELGVNEKKYKAKLSSAEAEPASTSG
ncbi:heme-thiolate peroxidase [Gymnopilus junonius]|uniref:Heme-thiolate peroxidase n=1 Tax=Gymnopilus junonius TaxID=109634 RepID=A0A9P5NSQ2_GYMJU|nr:heme-thiolate peroxidase [Gymnopilus junonius]